jgi:hypothetical protein
VWSTFGLLPFSTAAKAAPPRKAVSSASHAAHWEALRGEQSPSGLKRAEQAQEPQEAEDAERLEARGQKRRR